MSSLIDVGRKWQGRVIDGKFPLREWLGGSEHSAVFLTERSGDRHQKAAIKLIPAEVFSAGNLDVAAQLRRWAESAKLSHPHLMRLYESGRAQIDGENFLYVVMEFAEENLAQILPQRPLSPAEVGEMLPPTVEALAFLHRTGFVHGHLRPSNVFAVDNHLKISADSLRKTGERDQQASSVYIAPEVANAGAGLSPAADVWSLGVMLVAIMTQKEPGITNTKSGAVAAIPYKVAQPYYAIAQSCLRHDPRERCTMNDILKPRAQVARPGRPVEKTGLAKRSKLWLILPVVAVAILLAFLFARGRHEVPAPTAESPTPAASAPGDQSPAPFTEKANPAQARTERGRVLQQVLPDVSRGAQNTITGRVKVRVQVSVDASGNVSEAKLVSPGPSQYFANKALSAARRWKFNPPQVNGQPSSSQWVLRFEFGRKSTQVFPSEIKP